MHKRIIMTAGIAAVLPAIVFAQTAGNTPFDNTLNIVKGYVNTILAMALPIAVAVFFFGLIKFMRAGDSADIKKEGKKIMINSGVALFLMVGIWSVLGYLSKSVGLNNQGLDLTGNTPRSSDIIPQ